MFNSILTGNPLHRLALLVIGLAAITTPLQAAEADPLTEGGWLAEAGVDRFVFVFIESAEGPRIGMSHSLRDGRQYMQCPFTVASYEHPEVEFVMAGTGVRYRGRVDLEAGKIDGGLIWSADDGMDLDLVRIDPTTEPGYSFRTDANPYTYAPPASMDDGWLTDDAAGHGLSAQVLEDIVAAAEEGQAGLLHSLLVVKDGKLIMEEYFHGYDHAFLHPQASVTKSVSALLVGIALGRGEIGDLQTPLLDFFPTATPGDDCWSSVTLEHLLTMSIGLDWSDDQAENLHGTGPDFFAGVMKRGCQTEPGVTFRYVNANVNLLSGVIKEATGLFPDKFAERHLFAPLGIDRWNWDYAADAGHRLMDGSLQLRPRDMARLGQLMLNGGKWKGLQVLPADFAKAATTQRIDTDDPPGMRGGYGYLWWTLETDGKDGPLEIAFANGWGSQFIIVVPKLDLVIVTTGGNQDNGMHMAPHRTVGLALLRGLGAQ